MESVSNNDYSPSNPQAQPSSAGFFSNTDLLSHFVNLAQERRKSFVHTRSSPERLHSPDGYLSRSSGRNNNNAEEMCASAELYSVLLNNQQLGRPSDDKLCSPAQYSPPSRHPSEPDVVSVRRAHADEDHIGRGGGSNRDVSSSHTSPTSTKRQQHSQHQHQNNRQHPQQSSDNHKNGSSHSSQLSPRPPGNEPLPPPPQAVVFSLTKSELEELRLKAGSSLPAVISTEEIKKANNSSQLYVLVPSHYPVIVTCQSSTPTHPLPNQSQVNSTHNDQEMSVDDERNSLTPPPPTHRLPPPKSCSNSSCSTARSVIEQLVNGGVVGPEMRAPRKNSTNIPPMLLQSMKEIVPPHALRGVDCVETGNNPGSSGDSTLPHLSSLALAYGFSSSTNSISSRDSDPSSRHHNHHVRHPSDLDAGSGGDPILISSPEVGAAGTPSVATTNDVVSRLLLEEYRSGGGGGGGGGVGMDVKIKPPPPTDGCCAVDSLLSADSNGSNSIFFPSNDSPPSRNYMGRLGGGSGTGSAPPTGPQSGGNGDPKDIRRRVSHNEVERRRRDRINTWIAELYKLLPPEQQAKSQYQSKGVVLKRVCEYFQNHDANMKALREQNNLFNLEICRLTRENQMLRDALLSREQQQQQPHLHRSQGDTSDHPSPPKRHHLSSE